MQKHGLSFSKHSVKNAPKGTRAGAHSDCFEKRKDMDRYMPLWFWDNETKQWYKNHEGIRYSDCYEVGV